MVENKILYINLYINYINLILINVKSLWLNATNATLGTLY